MLYLIITIILSVVTGVIFKIIGHHQLQVFPVLLINYILALFISIFTTENPGFGDSPVLFFVLSFILGLIFVSTYNLMNKVMPKLGVGLTVSLSRLSAVMPTLGSIFIFKEQLQSLQIPGIIIAFLSLPLTAEEIPRKENLKKLFYGGMGWGLLLFTVFGINDFIFKIKSELLSSVDSNFFLIFVFLTSLIASLIIVVTTKKKITPVSILLGIILGAVNSQTAFFMFKTLEVLPGALVYPLLGISVIILTTFLGALIWKEKIRKHNYVFLIMALIAVVLLN